MGSLAAWGGGLIKVLSSKLWKNTLCRKRFRKNKRLTNLRWHHHFEGRFFGVEKSLKEHKTNYILRKWMDCAPKSMIENSSWCVTRTFDWEKCPWMCMMISGSSFYARHSSCPTPTSAANFHTDSCQSFFECAIFLIYLFLSPKAILLNSFDRWRLINHTSIFFWQKTYIAQQPL